MLMSKATINARYVGIDISLTKKSFQQQDKHYSNSENKDKPKFHPKGSSPVQVAAKAGHQHHRGCGVASKTSQCLYKLQPSIGLLGSRPTQDQTSRWLRVQTTTWAVRETEQD